MSSVEVLSLEQAERWDEWIYKSESPDIYWLSGYCALYEKKGEGTARLFVYQDGKSAVLYPFLLREIHQLPQLASVWTQDDPILYDISTPYGYGGPICVAAPDGDRRSLFLRFEEAFQEYCTEYGIIAEFVRFSPLLNNERDYPAVNPVQLRNTVSIPIDCDIAEIMARFTPNNRNRIKVSLKSNLTYSVIDYPHIDTFVEMYYQTMRRKEAQDYYFFPLSFFHDMYGYLQDQLTILEVRTEDGVVVSTALFMHMGQYVHYHLGASNPDYIHLSPNNAMMYYAIQHFKEKGYKQIHLGGGYTGNDSLYRFKKGFNREAPCSYFVGKKIRHEAWYREIERRLAILEQEEDGYFPSYRNPQLLTKVNKECELNV